MSRNSATEIARLQSGMRDVMVRLRNHILLFCEGAGNIDRFYEKVAAGGEINLGVEDLRMIVRDILNISVEDINEGQIKQLFLFLDSDGDDHVSMEELKFFIEDDVGLQTHGKGSKLDDLCSKYEEKARKMMDQLEEAPQANYALRRRGGMQFSPSPSVSSSSSSPRGRQPMSNVGILKEITMGRLIPEAVEHLPQGLHSEDGQKRLLSSLSQLVDDEGEKRRQELGELLKQVNSLADERHKQQQNQAASMLSLENKTRLEEELWARSVSWFETKRLDSEIAKETNTSSGPLSDWNFAETQSKTMSDLKGKTKEQEAWEFLQGSSWQHCHLNTLATTDNHLLLPGTELLEHIVRPERRANLEPGSLLATRLDAMRGVVGSLPASSSRYLWRSKLKVQLARQIKG